MKKQKKSGSVQIWKLPNHSWFPSDWYPQGSQFDKPEIVIRRTGGGVLVRERTWSAAKDGRPYDYSKTFCGENRPNDTWKPMDLYIWGDSTIGILGQKAKDGNAAAAEELWRLAAHATGLLTQVCKTKPELLRPVARKNRQWPVFRKKNAELSESEKDLFSAIQLGADDFVELDAKAKWRFDDAGIIAYSLLNYVRAARGDESTVSSFDYGSFGKCAQKHLLREFDKDSAPKWWKFAREILLLSYPKPAEITELNALLPAKFKDNYPSQRRQGILDKLESRFLSFARNPHKKSIHRCHDCGKPANDLLEGVWTCPTCKKELAKLG
jgi:hypothetical protein